MSDLKEKFCTKYPLPSEDSFLVIRHDIFNNEDTNAGEYYSFEKAKMNADALPKDNAPHCEFEGFVYNHDGALVYTSR